VPADNRDLNYNKYLSEGDKMLSRNEEYHSHNTKLLTIEEIKRKLLSLEYVQEINSLKKRISKTELI
jgi:UDP-glucose 4-epimerase